MAIPTQGDYYWRVHAGNGVGQTPNAEWFNYYYYSPSVTPPYLVSPVQAEVVPGTTDFVFRHNSFEAWHEFCVTGPNDYQDCNMWFSALEICDGSDCTVSFETPTYDNRYPWPLADGNYRWWARSHSPSGGTGAWSAAGDFTVANPQRPANFEPGIQFAPFDYSDGSVTLVWRENEDYPMPVYTVQLYGTAAGPVTYKTRREICENGHCQITLDQAPGSYYWRIGGGYGWTDIQWGSWSAAPFVVR